MGKSQIREDLSFQWPPSLKAVQYLLRTKHKVLPHSSKLIYLPNVPKVPTLVTFGDKLMNQAISFGRSLKN